MKYFLTFVAILMLFTSCNENPEINTDEYLDYYAKATNGSTANLKLAAENSSRDASIMDTSNSDVENKNIIGSTPGNLANNRYIVSLTYQGDNIYFSNGCIFAGTNEKQDFDIIYKGIQPVSLNIQGNHLYFTDYKGDNNIVLYRLDVNSHEVTEIETGKALDNSLLVYKDTIYFTYREKVNSSEYKYFCGSMDLNGDNIKEELFGGSASVKLLNASDDYVMYRFKTDMMIAEGDSPLYIYNLKDKSAEKAVQGTWAVATDNSKIYYCEPNNMCLFVTDLESRESTKLQEEISQYTINSDENYVYYIDKKSGICKIEKQTGETSLVFKESYISQMFIADDYIYYVTGVDSLYRVKTDGTNFCEL